MASDVVDVVGVVGVGTSLVTVVVLLVTLVSHKNLFLVELHPRAACVGYLLAGDLDGNVCHSSIGECGG